MQVSNGANISEVFETPIFLSKERLVPFSCYNFPQILYHPYQSSPDWTILTTIQEIPFSLSQSNLSCLSQFQVQVLMVERENENQNAWQSNLSKLSIWQNGPSSTAMFCSTKHWSNAHVCRLFCLSSPCTTCSISNWGFCLFWASTKSLKQSCEKSNLAKEILEHSYLELKTLSAFWLSSQTMSLSLTYAGSVARSASLWPKDW